MAIVIESRVFSKTSIPAPHPTVDVFVRDGFTMTGGGALVEYQEPGNLLSQSYPIQGPAGAWTGWRVYGKDCWVPSMGKITAYAIGVKVTKDGEPVALEQTVITALGGKAELPHPAEGDAWVGAGGGAKCDQNIYENVLLSESTPRSDADGIISHWSAAKQYCGSPTSNGGPSGGGSLTSYLIAIRAAGIQFKTKILHQDSEVDSRPSVEVSAEGGVVVSGGVRILESQSSWASSDAEQQSLLTATCPMFDDPATITGWKGAAKDHNIPSSVAIRASVVTLSAE